MATVMTFDPVVKELRKFLQVPEIAYSWSLRVSYVNDYCELTWKEPECLWVRVRSLGFGPKSKQCEAIAEFLGISQYSRGFSLMVEPEEVVEVREERILSTDRKLVIPPLEDKTDA